MASRTPSIPLCGFVLLDNPILQVFLTYHYPINNFSHNHVRILNLLLFGIKYKICLVWFGLFLLKLSKVVVCLALFGLFVVWFGGSEASSFEAARAFLRWFIQITGTRA